MDWLLTHGSKRCAGLLLIALAINSLCGCASIFRENYEPITVTTNPAGRTVYFLGSTVSDGEQINVSRRFETPFFNVEDGGIGRTIPLDYRPHPWLAGDAALLLVFVVPGLVAFGVDVATGAWRDIEEKQIVFVPDRETRDRTAQNSRPDPPRESADPLRHPIQP